MTNRAPCGVPTPHPPARPSCLLPLDALRQRSPTASGPRTNMCQKPSRGSFFSFSLSSSYYTPALPSLLRSSRFYTEITPRIYDRFFFAHIHMVIGIPHCHWALACIAAGLFLFVWAPHMFLEACGFDLILCARGRAYDWRMARRAAFSFVC